MAFDAEPTRTPVNIGEVTIVLRTDPNDAAQQQGALFEIEVLLSDGTNVNRRGDLVPHITTAQRTALMSFMDSLRTQAETEILP